MANEYEPLRKLITEDNDIYPEEWLSLMGYQPRQGPIGISTKYVDKFLADMFSQR